MIWKKINFEHQKMWVHCRVPDVDTKDICECDMIKYQEIGHAKNMANLTTIWASTWCGPSRRTLSGRPFHPQPSIVLLSVPFFCSARTASHMQYHRTEQNRTEKKNIDHWIWEQIRYSVCSSLSTPMASMPICVMCVFNVQNYAIYIYLIYEKKNELKEDKSILFDPREQRHRMKKKQNRTNSIPISTQFCSIPFGPPNPEHPRTRSCPMLLLLFVSLLTLHNTKCSHQQIPFNVNKNQMVSNKVDVITIPVSEQQMHSRHPTYQLQRQSSQ